jgi:pyrimidine operon attenuation protein/uracil phosphoribosyltransferase
VAADFVAAHTRVAPGQALRLQQGADRRFILTIEHESA